MSFAKFVFLSAVVATFVISPAIAVLIWLLIKLFNIH